MISHQTQFGKPIEEIYAGVHDGKILGSGASGVVRLVTHRSTGIKYAAKCLDIWLIKSQEQLKQLRDEIFIMCQVRSQKEGFSSKWKHRNTFANRFDAHAN